MADELKNKEFATTFANAKQKMIATNESTYGSRYSRQFRSRIRDYSPEEIERILQSGSLVEQQKLSRNYFYKDGYYRQILTYYATLLKYVGLLIPNPSFGKSLSTPHIKKRYYQALEYVEAMDLPVFLTNCALRALIDGSYFGLITKLDKSTFTVIDLPTGYCCSRFKDIYGNDIIEFDVTYFNSIIDETERKSALSVYPKVIRTAYAQYRNGNSEKRWVIVPSEIGICFPFFDGRPPFVTIIPATIQYDEAVDTARERDLEEIRKIIVQQIPHLADGRLLFEPDEAEQIHAGTVGMMKGNPNVSVLTTYADVDAIQSQTTSDTTKNSTLTQMLQNIYTKSGTSSEIFAAKGNTSLSTSLKKDLALMMTLASRFSTFVTNIVNSIYQNSNVNFKFTILPISYFNCDDYINSTFKLASSGYSFLLPALALGLSQKDLGNIKDLENDVLQLGEKLRPLESSYTQSAQDNSDEGGRPAVNDEDKADQTIANEESANSTNEEGASE